MMKTQSPFTSIITASLATTTLHLDQSLQSLSLIFLHRARVTLGFQMSFAWIIIAAPTNTTINFHNTSGRDRTRDRHVKSVLLLPTELRRHIILYSLPVASRERLVLPGNQKYPWRESNPHPLGPDFESGVSANFTTRA